MEGWKLVAMGAAVMLLGMTAGAQLFGAHAAEAQTTERWHDCFVARQESVDTNGSGTTETVRLDHTILVPSGYVPIGGGGMTGSSAWIGGVVLCRH